MRSIDLLLDKAREKCERPSDRALAEKLRVTASAVSKWRKGGVITEMHATALAAIAGLDGEIVVRVMEEQAETPAQRRVWRSVLDRLSAAAAVLMLVVFAAPGAARAKAIDSQGFSGVYQPHSVYYVQSLSEDARVPLASITGLAMPSQEASLPSVPLAAWLLRLPPSSDHSLVHDPGDPAADQATPRDNDLFLFKGGSIQSLIGNESQRSQ
ncbi:DUF3693 domain-containing protein [Stenotrophomonas geniculata]|uniref:DUF3693 domain-containing protein n=1 Tax=Stenotrophomonas geniculata TaxID=86188 RepID=UPI0039C6B7AF